MLTESTSNKIQSLYNKYLNDISLFPEEDLRLLMNYYSEHPLFKDILKTKGFTVFKKILTNIRLRLCERHDTIVKFDSNKNVFNILLFGNIKKRNVFKGVPEEGLFKKNSGKFLYCVYHCLSNSLFAEIDRKVYMKYLVSSANDLYEKFVEKISKYSLFYNLPDYQKNNLFLNYQEKKYGIHDIVYEEGDKIDGIYLIIKGKCLVLKKKVNILSIDNIDNSILHYQNNNFLTISASEMHEKKKQETCSSFVPLFAKTKNNNILLTMSEGDIFGDLEINLNDNKRKYTVKCGNFSKTKIWYFPLKIIKSIINNFKELSMQKDDIIKTRFEYANLVDKVKKNNTIDKSEIKIDEIINKCKGQNSNFKSFQQKINKCSFKSCSNKRNFLNNKYLNTSRNQMLKTSSIFINKDKNQSTSKTKLRILSYKSQNQRNLVTIRRENNYLNKINSKILSMKSVDTPRLNIFNNLIPIDHKLFLKKKNKKNPNFLIHCSNNETF